LLVMPLAVMTRLNKASSMFMVIYIH
jgi:hypothetical protein